MGRESIKSHEDLAVYQMAFDAAMTIFYSRRAWRARTLDFSSSRLAFSSLPPLKTASRLPAHLHDAKHGCGGCYSCRALQLGHS